MSHFVVSARKYRPQVFEDVIGQAHIARTLRNALETDKLAHAFLFCGPRGVGKTTCARILAKVLNCENKPNAYTPCNACSSCESFNANASFNILELDAASNNSVNDVRNLIEQVRFQPQKGAYKVFIIDEVHMLSTQAFNAFLKTLEEPPSYAIFILATTEKHKIIPTILSRCQIFDFKSIQPEDIVVQLEHITEQEGRKADREALYIIGEKADGAMRDALSIYDKIASASTGNITYKDVIDNLNILDFDYYFKLVESFLTQDLAATYVMIDDIVSKGFDLEQTMLGVSEHMRQLLMAKDQETVDLIHASPALKKRYQEQASLIHRNFILSALNLLNQADIHLPRAKNKRLHVEVALSKLVFLSQINEGGLLEKKTLDVSEPSVANTENKVSHKTTTSSEIATSYVNQELSPESVAADPESGVIEKSEEPRQGNGQKTTESQEIKQDIAQPEGVIKIKRKAKTSSIVNTPTISSTQHLIEQVQQIEEDQLSLRKNLNVEMVKALWNEYAENSPSPSVKTALQMAELSLEDHRIELIVPSSNTKNIILQETALVDRLREKTGTLQLKLDINIDPNAFPEVEQVKPKVLLTPKEKYELLRNKNPKIDLLRDAFDLEVDS